MARNLNIQKKDDNEVAEGNSKKGKEKNDVTHH